MKKLKATLGAAVFVLMAGSAQAASLCTGINLGTSDTSDFTLGGVDSSACVISDVNPDGTGAGGNSSGFSPSPFGTGWTLLAKMTSDTSPSSLGGVNYDWGITFDTAKNGNWSFGANQTVKLDLVMAMHASNHSGSFLFDGLILNANQTQQGTWVIKWVNNGGQNPDYSNSSLWVRGVTPVPEPETYALMLAGLGLVGAIARRRKASQE